MYTVLVTDYHWPTLDIEQRILSEINAELLVAETGDEAELIELAPHADAILFCWQQVTHAVLDAAVNCKVASRYGVGLDNIDLDYATQLGIPVTYVPDYCMEDVSDHAMALLLACARSIQTYDRSIREGQWNLGAGQPMFRLRDKVLAIIGYGNIGRALVPKAQGFGIDVQVYAPRLPEGTLDGVTITHDLPGLLQVADFVSLHVPLNESTQQMVNREFLAHMKTTAYLINTSRGGVIDEDALYETLANKQIAGAALDVLTQEPPDPQTPLLQLDNILITPHAAFSSQEAIAELQEKAARHIVQALRGERPDRLVNPAVLEQPNCRIKVT